MKSSIVKKSARKKSLYVNELKRIGLTDRILFVIKRRDERTNCIFLM